MEEEATSRRRSGRGAGNLRWAMIFMAFVATSINYVDRANLSVAVPFLDRDLHLSTTTTGYALSAFFFTYAFFNLLMGYLVDRIGARIMYGFSVLWWSVFTAATALANSFLTLLGLRLALGAGEAGAYPSNAKVVAEWFPVRERAFATSIFDNGARVGTALSLPIVTLIIGTLGWRWSFVISGTLGLAWFVFWVWIYRPPSQHPWVKQSELEYIRQGAREESPEADRAPRLRWIDLFRYRNVWGMMIGFFCLNFIIYFFITWYPDYMVKVRHFTLLKLGIYGTIPALVAILGGWAGGLVADRLVRSGMDLTRARKLCLVGGMAVSSVIAISGLVESATIALALLAISYASLTFAAASVWSLPADVAPTPHHVSSIGGIQNFASNVAGIIGPSFFGLVAAATGSFVAPLAIAGAVGVAGALTYLFVVGTIEPLPLLGRRRAV
jgi:ACS family D-galactonate transporter-like MFS transporter